MYKLFWIHYRLDSLVGALISSVQVKVILHKGTFRVSLATLQFQGVIMNLGYRSLQKSTYSSMFTILDRLQIFGLLLEPIWYINKYELRYKNNIQP